MVKWDSIPDGDNYQRLISSSNIYPLWQLMGTRDEYVNLDIIPYGPFLHSQTVLLLNSLFLLFKWSMINRNRHLRNVKNARRRGVVPIIINLGGDDDRRRALGIVVTRPKESGSNQSIEVNVARLLLGLGKQKFLHLLRVLMVVQGNFGSPRGEWTRLSLGKWLMAEECERSTVKWFIRSGISGLMGARGKGLIKGSRLDRTWIRRRTVEFNAWNWRNLI